MKKIYKIYISCILCVVTLLVLMILLGISGIENCEIGAKIMFFLGAFGYSQIWRNTVDKLFGI